MDTKVTTHLSMVVNWESRACLIFDQEVRNVVFIEISRRRGSVGKTKAMMKQWPSIDDIDQFPQRQRETTLRDKHSGT